MAKKYLDYDGLTYLWGKIKNYIDTHGGGGSVTVDSALSSTSENPVQNKVIYSALSGKANSSDLVYQDYSFTVTYSAGTVGTRGAQYSTSAAKSGYTPVSATPVSVGNSNAYIPVTFFSGTTLYLNAYRASTSAVSNSAVIVRVFYIKS